jgi:hypothetical protein
MIELQVFERCVQAIRKGVLIRRVSTGDKEFHFQNWFIDRLQETGKNFEAGGRNSYPDFRMVETTEGFELKALAYPGREANFDSNSQVPTGFHNGRAIYYVFGRYPREADGSSYPILDLVLCHGDFLNADHDYVHQNKNVKGFGSYGDVMIRDRKMYVVPTPFQIVDGVAHQSTLIIPAAVAPGKKFFKVGELCRREAAEFIVGYSFDLRSNRLVPRKAANPGAGREHFFNAWRLKGSPAAAIKLRVIPAEIGTVERDTDDGGSGEAD